MKIIFVQTNYPGFLESLYRLAKINKKTSYSQIKRLWAKEFFGSADFYLKNLKRLGWTGDEIVVNDWRMQSKWMEERGLFTTRQSIGWLEKLPHRLKNILGIEGWIKDIFFKQLKSINPDVVYVHDVTIFNKADLSKIKKYAKLLVGQIAYPLPLNDKILKGYDLMISSFPHYVKRFRKMGIKSEYLRWCVEHSILSKVAGGNTKYDVAYVGGFTPHHSNGNKILENLAKKVKVDFWGYGENFLLPNSQIKKGFHGQAWGKDMYNIFRNSKIAVNRHINISEKYANNMRMFDATAMGALLITDQKSNMKEFFEVGKEVVTYKDANDLVDKVKYYLVHEDERSKIAKAGQRRTLKDHTYKVRMKELNSILLKYLHK